MNPARHGAVPRYGIISRLGTGCFEGMAWIQFPEGDEELVYLFQLEKLEEPLPESKEKKQ